MPLFNPVTTPVVASTTAIVGLLLLHVPPGTELLSVAAVPIHTDELPVIGGTPGLTVTDAVADEVQIPLVIVAT